MKYPLILSFIFFTHTGHAQPFAIFADNETPPIHTQGDAADDPARPVPTTIISNFLLFAGLTSGTLDLYLVHFDSSGPSGTLLSSIIRL